MAKVSSSSASGVPVAAAAAAKEDTPGIVSTSTCGARSRTTRARWPKVEKVEASPSTRKSRSTFGEQLDGAVGGAHPGPGEDLCVAGHRENQFLGIGRDAQAAALDDRQRVRRFFGLFDRVEPAGARLQRRPGAAGDHFGVAGAERGADQFAVARYIGHALSLCAFRAATIQTGFCAARRCMSRIGWLRLA